MLYCPSGRRWQENVSSSNYDEEWIDLMLLAKQIGVTPEEVKSFLLQPK
ncbi:anti-repressor SinI family protein [Neobacillus soli]|nr:anti-repressor SinI family protein [Neobacillus soli]